MKQQLDENNISALIAYRLQRAHETLDEVPYHAKHEFYNTAVNRLYYACYYAVVALLVKYRIEATSHAGVKQMLGLHFVLTGKLSREQNRYFSILFERRHSSDYNDFAYSTAEEIAELQPKANAFIAAIEVLINNEQE